MRQAVILDLSVEAYLLFRQDISKVCLKPLVLREKWISLLPELWSFSCITAKTDFKQEFVKI